MQATLHAELELWRRMPARSPHVLPLLAAGKWRDGQPFLLLELALCDLHSFAASRAGRGEPLTLDEALVAADHVAAGLLSLHPAALHGDLKPRNVVLVEATPGAPLNGATLKLTDLGAAQRARGAQPARGTWTYQPRSVLEGAHVRFCLTIANMPCGAVLCL